MQLATENGMLKRKSAFLGRILQGRWPPIMHPHYKCSRGWLQRKNKYYWI